MNSLLNSPASPVLVTGGASGIGEASAAALAAVGRPVAIWDLQADKAQAVAARLAEEHGVPCVGIAIDLCDPAAIAPALQRTRAELGAPGGLVHAAGMVDQSGLEQLTVAGWDRVLDLNLRAMALLVQAMLPDLRANPGSAVVGIASINATLGNGLIPAYSASKGGLLSLVRSLADALGADGIRVNSVSPGQIFTPMIAPIVAANPGVFERRILLGRLGRAEEVARVVRFLLSDEASYINAAEILVDGGNISSQR
ncbi:SDR family NAD(P)-dependent oxidoreductase [Pseudomonas panipatensis]|uniref:NAD(P)-dependent dehydrogenase, short-chain alcohol dehydrogenase family n=1 Tax=Pseudomonas panipatensis TaxID=428992 RepID=A0A1G8EMW1_9PSED|nr:SDR family NAD(P)-dependent oxidoreductase [Pseudomonas panipatensis]SDH71208.1 NAD(P)-dependent dehydrogenase, short-chain alcohol dehydrogenase family [Pseudomonas panipatensis]SMP68420.1 NAD(P)-dependent dehydrogenase, short-chain alcohol dehydrogenase family [Pseudomonas panipatensis]